MGPVFGRINHSKSTKNLKFRTKTVFRLLCLNSLLPKQKCECSRHMKHVKGFIKKNPGADGIFGIVDVEPGEWLANLDHPEKNTAHWCQLCVVLEDTIRISKPGRKDVPASFNPFEWKESY